MRGPRTNSGQDMCNILSHKFCKKGGKNAANTVLFLFRSGSLQEQTAAEHALSPESIPGHEEHGVFVTTRGLRETAGQIGSRPSER
jgi:hypothetical protein